MHPCNCSCTRDGLINVKSDHISIAYQCLVIFLYSFKAVLAQLVTNVKTLGGRMIQDVDCGYFLITYRHAALQCCHIAGAVQSGVLCLTNHNAILVITTIIVSLTMIKKHTHTHTHTHTHILYIYIYNIYNLCMYVIFMPD